MFLAILYYLSGCFVSRLPGTLGKSTFPAVVVGRKTEKMLRILGILAGGDTAQLREKSETASKVAGS